MFASTQLLRGPHVSSGALHVQVYSYQLGGENGVIVSKTMTLTHQSRQITDNGAKRRRGCPLIFRASRPFLPLKRVVFTGAFLLFG